MNIKLADKDLSLTVEAEMKFMSFFDYMHKILQQYESWHGVHILHGELHGLKGRIDRLPFAAKWVQLH